MNFKEKLPNEMWLEVFSYLPLDTLRSLSSTQRALHNIARPFGFADFRVRPHLCSHPPLQGQLDDAMERLRFWSSPKMAPHVRSCTASQHWRALSSPSWHILINSFLQFLPRFTGLHRLHLDHIQFTQTVIIDLCGLPALTHAKFLRCGVRSGEHLDPGALTLRVTNFTVDFISDDDGLGDLWISLLSCDTLQELHFSSLQFRPEFSPFPNLHTIGVKFWSPNTSAILPKFPQVRNFAIRTWGDLGTLTPSERVSIFPVLQTYTGTYEALGLFIQRTTLTHITLSSCRFFEFLTELRGVNALPNITSLTACFYVFETAGIDALFGFFPNLTELQLTFSEEDESIPQPTSIIKMLPSNAILPRTLESISLRWYYMSRFNNEGNRPAPPDPAQLPDFARLRDTLIAKCPALTYIFLDGYHFLFVWRKTSPLVQESTAYSFYEAEVIRAKIRETSVPV
ncbi:hypothetical protein K438DRAFT_1986860 [Mycena galopus ATCC 62051]|nr:hypothetical protein K438DRAFT_1986860 [Mycena galopus ATCC 62051]